MAPGPRARATPRGARHHRERRASVARGVALRRWLRSHRQRLPAPGRANGGGSIENGWLRCPWHGYDFSPCDGKPPGGFADGIEAFAVETRDDGVYVAVPPEPLRPRTVSDVLVDTMQRHPECDLTVLCGHTHSPGEATVLPNLVVKTGGAVYSHPRIQERIVIE